MSTKFALLGLLNIRKMSAYDLAKFAKESIGYFWNESYSNVHRTLNTLAEEKLVEKTSERSGRNKIVYQITNQGIQAFAEWLSNHEHSTIYRDELLLKLFVSRKSDYPAILEDLKHALDELLAQRQVYAELKEFIASKPENLSYELTLDYGIVQNEATIQWLKETIKRIEETL